MNLVKEVWMSHPGWKGLADWPLYLLQLLMTLNHAGNMAYSWTCGLQLRSGLVMYKVLQEAKALNDPLLPGCHVLLPVPDGPGLLSLPYCVHMELHQVCSSAAVLPMLAASAFLLLVLR